MSDLPGYLSENRLYPKTHQNLFEVNPSGCNIIRNPTVGMDFPTVDTIWHIIGKLRPVFFANIPSFVKHNTGI